MQRHQAPGFFSHRQSPWCAAQLKEQRWQAGVLNLIFFHLDSTHPLPFMIIKPIFIEKLYREDCHIKLTRMFYFQPIVPLQKREGIMSSGRTWHTFMSHKFIKSSSVMIVWAKQKSIMCYLALWQRNFRRINLDKICSPITYRLARFSLL